MQFYMLHSDPVPSSRALPDYALFQVNLREGWQILSDIVHTVYGTTERDACFPGQNKLYSASHALTRQLGTKAMFVRFMRHYTANLDEYERRKGKPSAYAKKYDSFLRNYFVTVLAYQLPADIYESARQYITTAKADKLTASESENILELTK